MCEHCSEARYWDEEIPEDEIGEHLCDHCGQLTAVRIEWQRSVEDHICAYQYEKEEVDYDSGLGDRLRASGLQAGVDYLPITVEQVCTYPRGNPLMGEELTDCDSPAIYAKMVLQSFEYCEDHPD